MNTETVGRTESDSRESEEKKAAGFKSTLLDVSQRRDSGLSRCEWMIGHVARISGENPHQ